MRLVGGRLALDFINTADWATDNRIVHEKIESSADLQSWLQAVQVVARYKDDLADLIDFRFKLRELFLYGHCQDILNAVQGLKFGSVQTAPPTLIGLLSASAISILTDPREYSRLKKCPGENCGWLFIDETKNSRRTWCSMETCGNRAKAARHYLRHKKTRHS